ncbi:unnamed protein product [Owenia fusiformis]|uniref:C-type lectin domain-containing protein n=1 Tax=Owenia fusiformis TaxID=6347 RepID=A0A8S4P3W1_OWEFU|nr:unnamed protein product [Owenia fusiformis]
MKLAAIFYFAILHLSVAVSIGNENRTTATPKQDEPYEEAYVSDLEDYDDDMINMLVEDGVINGPSDGYALDKYDMTDEDDFGELLEAHVSRKKRDVEALEELIQPRVSRKKRDVTISKRDAHGHDTPTSSHENVDGCPPYFVQCMSKCYFFSNFIYKYDDARKACQASGADLVAIESVQEDLFLTKKLKLFTKTAKKLKQGGPKAVKKSSGFRFDAIVRAMKARGLAHALPAHLRHMAKNDKPSEDLPNGWWTSARTALPYVNRHSPQEWVWEQTNKTVGYTRWYSSGHPKTNIPCVAMWRRFKNLEWASTPCNTYLGLACEKDISY